MTGAQYRAGVKKMLEARANPLGLFKKKKATPNSSEPPKPEPVKPTPAIEKKLLAYNDALIEYNDEYEYNEGQSIGPLQNQPSLLFRYRPNGIWRAHLHDIR